MSVRIRITMLFASIVLVILLIVCGSVYYFSYTNRVNTIKTRLTNWGITTASLLGQSGVFNEKLILKIDASTILTMKDKTVQAYDSLDRRIYMYSDDSSDILRVGKTELDKARRGRDVYFRLGGREALAHYYKQGGFEIVVVSAAYDQEGLKKLEQLEFILLFSFVGGILIAIIAGYWFSRRLLVPLRRIADEVNEISVQNLEGRIKAGSGKDEWNYLAGTLNQLLYRLQESIDIHRRFISNASHELSTPLTSISSQLEISLTRDRDASEYRKVMNSIYQDVRQLNRLTQTLLEFARASGDPGGLEIDLVRVDEVLLALPGEITKLNKDYSVNLAFDQLPEEDEKLLVFGNEQLLFTAIKNIAINACKYGDKLPANVRLRFHENVITIEIEDNGRGIPQEELENIFHPFYRIDGNQLVPGFGLGLSMSRQIIKLHKGELIVHSVLGKGSLFTINLPSAGNLLQKK
jgi:two-component system sensor histidine kinase ArlS